MRSLRPTGWRRVSVRAGLTDRLEDSPKGRQPDLHRVRPGSGTHPHADQFCLCSGGPSAATSILAAGLVGRSEEYSHV